MLWCESTVFLTCTLMMATSAVGMQFFGQIPLALRIGVPLVMAAVAVWLWLRPDE